MSEERAVEIVRVFDFEDQPVRTVIGPDGEPWFVGVDVCRVLGLANSRDALARLDQDEKGVGNTDTPGGVQETTIISEPGVYRLIFTSRKEEAERFKRWLAHEVLPALRRTGRFELAQPVPPTVLENPLDEWRTWLSVIDTGRRIYGNAAARRLWSRSPLPSPDEPAPGEPLDDIDRFLAEATVPAPGCWLHATALYQCYRGWARENGVPAASLSMFGRQVSLRGIKNMKAPGSTVRRLDITWGKNIYWQWGAGDTAAA